jgi:hypothetical protein
MFLPQSYKAFRRSKDGLFLEMVEEKLPSSLQPQDVLIRIRAVSVNYRDVAMMHGKYPVSVNFAVDLWAIKCYVILVLSESSANQLQLATGKIILKFLTRCICRFMSFPIVSTLLFRRPAENPSRMSPVSFLV